VRSFQEGFWGLTGEDSSGCGFLGGLADFFIFETVLRAILELVLQNRNPI